MNPTYTRREMLGIAGKSLVAGALLNRPLSGADKTGSAPGAIVGNPAAAKVGDQVFREGGNAIDAAIAAAFAGCVASPNNCGIGGYGGSATIALSSGKIVAFDFNSTAPAAARPDMFEIDAQGKVKGNANMHGWLATGVPGTAAGLDLILSRYGTRSLRQTLAPAIALSEEGQYAAALQNIAPGSRSAGKTPKAGPLELKRNRALGGLLKKLAARNSTESFYRGDIADTIAAAFAQNGGLVTKKDLASYRAREVTPVKMEWGGTEFHTVPLTATGVLVFEAMSILRELGWDKLSPAQQRHAKLEALRIAWADRLRTFGDTAYVKDPTDFLLSRPHLTAMAGQVRTALKAGRPVPLEVQRSLADGTINLSAGDRHGNMIAVTLTHGNAFGARVVVEELGMVLGHGMSRFDPRPGLPNSVGPGKRPQHNMCPSIATQAGRAILAIGGAGGIRIQNSVYEVLLQHSILGRPMDAAIAAPRLHTDGTLKLGLEKTHSAEDESFYKKIGYETVRGATANISAVTFDPRTGTPRAFARGP